MSGKSFPMIMHDGNTYMVVVDAQEKQMAALGIERVLYLRLVPKPVKYPFAVLDRYGELTESCMGLDEAHDVVKHWDASSKNGPHRIVRLVEV
jgi:hypothetical protein